jgi:hypothetical protein
MRELTAEEWENDELRDAYWARWRLLDRKRHEAENRNLAIKYATPLPDYGAATGLRCNPTMPTNLVLLTLHDNVVVNIPRARVLRRNGKGWSNAPLWEDNISEIMDRMEGIVDY